MPRPSEILKYYNEHVIKLKVPYSHGLIGSLDLQRRTSLLSLVSAFFSPLLLKPLMELSSEPRSEEEAGMLAAGVELAAGGGGALLGGGGGAADEIYPDKKKGKRGLKLKFQFMKVIQTK